MTKGILRARPVAFREIEVEPIDIDATRSLALVFWSRATSLERGDVSAPR